MSRLIVKGLPKYYNEEKLRDFFSKKGNVTDVKLMKKRNGESRRFAFIGYKSLEDAENAVRYFNKSFIDTARIDVELAKTFSDPTVPLSFKEKKRINGDKLREQEERLLKEQEERKIKKQKTGKSALDEEIANNPKLREFMEVLKPSHQVKSWANDAIADGSGGPSSKELENYLALKEDTNIQKKDYDVVNAPEAESDDEYEDFKKASDYDDMQDEEQMFSLNNIPEHNHNEVDNENVSDLDWLKRKRRRMRENEEEEEQIKSNNDKNSISQNGIDDSKSPEKRKGTERSIVEKPEISVEEQTVQKISETGRLFIRNILYSSTEEDFKDLFNKFGDLEEVHVAIDTRTGNSKGFVYIQFKSSDDAVSAYHALDKQIFQGRLLHILPGEKKKDHRLDEFDIKNMPLKKQRELKKKAQASKSQFSWNSLYMNTDAVLDSVAAQMGISKSQLIDPENSGSAVKQALAEAHVIGNVRKFFEERGIDLTAFSKKERDDKIILVKNFPYGTTIEEIGEMFSQYGELKRTIMPPEGTIAIVEFRDSPSARAAFTKLAYRRFKKSIIYLEKGPKDLFTREPNQNEVSNSNATFEDVNAVEAKVSAHDILEDKSNSNESEVIDGPTVSIFVKNLNFSTPSSKLTDLFKSLNGFVVANVKTKADPKKAGEFLSMGFGFVEFKTKEQAVIAISSLDGSVLDGHKLQLKLSHRQSGNASTKKDKSNKSNKIIIKNLPFEATRKDILELFGAFGQLKSVRVPKKFDKSARGFAFVEFNLLKEAENAMDQLEGVHLLGRKLIMQFAELDAEDAEVEIEKMTKKVKKQVATQQLASARLVGNAKVADFEDEEADQFNSF